MVDKYLLLFSGQLTEEESLFNYAAIDNGATYESFNGNFTPTFFDDVIANLQPTDPASETCGNSQPCKIDYITTQDQSLAEDTKNTQAKLETICEYHSTVFNSLAPGKFEWNFRYVIFKQILVSDGWGISCEIALIWISLNFTDDQSTLVQVMAWCHQAPSHYLNHWCIIIDLTLVNKPHWNSNQDTIFFIKINTIGYIICKMSVIFSGFIVFKRVSQ